MRIGIDISVLCNQWDGIGTYTLDVIKYINSSHSKDTFFLYADRDLAVKLDLNSNFKVFVDNSSNHLLWLLTKLPKYAKRDQLDVFWQPNFILPFKVRGMRNIVTVHDMSAYSFSEYASTKTNITHKIFLKTTCKKADRIIAISNYVANDIIHNFPEVKEKVTMIYDGKKLFENGLNSTEEDCEEYLNKLGIKEKEYLLFVGTLSPRKNADVIIEGYFRYRENGGNKKMVLAGNIASKCENIKQKILNSQYVDDIVIAGYVTDLQKRILYYNAAMLLFPSRLEGFGFPLLEGMQAEIPVITSNCSCMPEIAKDAAIYLNDIDSVTEMAQRIFEVEHMSDEEKEELIHKGRKRVQYFDELNYPQRVFNEIIHIK